MFFSDLKLTCLDTVHIPICPALQRLRTVIQYDKGMRFSHDDLMGRIWQRSRWLQEDVSFLLPLVKYLPDAILICSHAPSPTHLFSPFILDVPQMHLAGRHTVYLRQIVHESEDVINLSAGCLWRTDSGNDTDIYWQFMCLIS